MADLLDKSPLNGDENLKMELTTLVQNFLAVQQKLEGEDQLDKNFSLVVHVNMQNICGYIFFFGYCESVFYFGLRTQK